MLELKNITKIFNVGTVNEQQLYDDFSLSIPEGQFVSVVGSNGSGKTSMLNVICGSIDIDAGAVMINDKDITKMKDFMRHKKMGRVYQDPSKGTCPSMNIIENLSIAENKGRRYNLGRCVNKARIDHYRDLLKGLNLGLEDKMHIPVGSLSGGQRQAITLLMASMNNPKLLLLDEHTAALDPKTAAKVLEATQKIVEKDNLTTLMITHNMRDAIAYGNRLIMMYNGHIVVDVSGEEKKKLTVEQLLNLFSQASGSDEVSDKMVLG